MTEKSEEILERERQAVASMASARANMIKVLDRVATLERELRNAQIAINTLKNYIAEGVYTYTLSGSSRKCRDIADDAIASILKALN